MKLVCHIGHHKTGTTSLQAFLAQNSQALLKAGILYPWVETQGAAVAMAKGIHGDLSAEMLPINVREAHNALAFRMLADALPNWKVPGYHKDLPHSQQMLLALHNQAALLMPEYTVLCSEVMSHFGRSAPDLIGKLYETLSPSSAHVHCTLRRPDEQLISWHGQLIRFGQSPAPLSTPEGLQLGGIHVDYKRVIAPWLKQMPGAAITLRPYRETLVAGGSIPDFIAQSGMPFPDTLPDAPKMNVSLPAAVLGILREANKQLPRPAAKALGRDLAKLAEKMDLPGTREVELLGAEARARLLDHFRPIHDYLGRISGRTAFFEDLEDIATCKPIPEAVAIRQLLDQLTPERLARISSPAARDFLAGQRDHRTTH